jgi:BirA family biotin operon repressor/biotin-[acetyl-CoA-carboxylase] ligase
VPEATSAWIGRDPDEWALHLGVPLLELYTSLPSTNARLRVLAREGAPAFSTVVAEEQTAGRGREGRKWHSPSGSGLWFSVLISLEPARTGGVLPLAVGVSVARAIERWNGAGVHLKWPNDLLVGDRKVAGVLCESVGDSGGLVAVGIGVNLRCSAPEIPAELAGSIGFMEPLAGCAISETDMAKEVITQLRRWAQPVPRTLTGPLRAEWESRDLLRGQSVRMDSGVAGRSLGVSSDGALILSKADGSLIAVLAGSVRLEEVGASTALYNGKPARPRRGGG